MRHYRELSDKARNESKFWREDMANSPTAALYLEFAAALDAKDAEIERLKALGGMP